ncbi:uncharacterized protein K02A2.6-like isoform X3 [Amphibalanus amphitrite]|uniref:uncharacterized protein K02A2.6-like isoform X3 n=1 Tax=Amphibalanus amphitrite TaxID=1232801 RepID=UPI001C92822D|nr:uncharacterized protein K02A2.6-like isoform X3 [Amphibalanus amphitrite]
MALQLPAVEPYRTEQERELRDRCVAGSFGQLREKLLLKAAEKGDDLTLMDIRSAARVYQDVRQLGSLVQGGAGATQVQAIRQDASKSADWRQRSGDGSHTGGPVKEFRGKCFKCGQVGHRKALCPSGAKMTCFQCGKPGHLKRDCPGRKPSGGGGRGGHGGQVGADGDSVEEEEVYLVRHWEEEGPALSAQEVETLTRRDSTLGRVLTYVRSGWPSVVEPEFRAFKQRSTELSTDGDCLLWGGRVVVPTKMRNRVLQELHAGHLGSGKMKQLARRYVWWPGLDTELESLARVCGSCVEKRAAPPKVSTGRSPAELLYGRTLRTRLDLLRPDRAQTAVDYQARMAETAGGELRGFGIGEDVWARSFSGPKWRRGRIAAKTGPVSYEVDVGDTCWSRHADQLLRAGQSGRGVTPEDIAGPDRARTPLDAAMGGTLPAPAAGPSASGSAGATGSVPAAAVVAPSPGPEEAGRPPPPEAERPPPPDSPGPAGVPARETPTRGTCDVRGADTASPAECSDAVPVLRRSSRVRREPDRLVVG